MPKSEKLFKSFDAPQLKEFNDAERSITHFITTESPDRSGDIVRADGMDAKSFMSNPVVLWAHCYDEPPIGKNLWMKTAEREGVKGVLVKTQFANTEDALQIYELWKGGFLNAASIGFIPKKSVDLSDRWWGPKEYLEWELLEYSIVPVPANGEALRNAVKSASAGVQKYVSKALAEYERVTVDEQLKAMDEKLKSVLDRIESLTENLKSLKSAADETNGANTETNGAESETDAANAETDTTEPAVETSVQTRTYDMKSVVSVVVDGEVSALKGL